MNTGKIKTLSIKFIPFQINHPRNVTPRILKEIKEEIFFITNTNISMYGTISFYSFAILKRWGKYMELDRQNTGMVFIRM